MYSVLFIRPYIPSIISANTCFPTLRPSVHRASSTINSKTPSSIPRPVSLPSLLSVLWPLFNCLPLSKVRFFNLPRYVYLFVFVLRWQSMRFPLLTRTRIPSIMRFTTFLAILPALAVAQEQAPLADRVQGWFDKAKSYLPTATPVVPVEKVVEQKVQEKAVTPFNLSNWQSALEPSSEPKEWLLFVTGGNKTCFGRCEQASKAFNVR